MNPISIMAIVGIILGAIVLVFSLVNRKKLPGWGKIIFPAIGVLIAVSGICMYIGVSTLG